MFSGGCLRLTCFPALGVISGIGKGVIGTTLSGQAVPHLLLRKRSAKELHFDHSLICSFLKRLASQIPWT